MSRYNRCGDCYNMKCIFVTGERTDFDSSECADFRSMTNADRIRGMSDEELAHLLHTAEEHIFSGNLWNYEQWRKWLKSPVEVDRRCQRTVSSDGCATRRRIPSVTSGTATGQPGESAS